MNLNACGKQFRTSVTLLSLKLCSELIIFLPKWQMGFSSGKIKQSKTKKVLFHTLLLLKNWVTLKSFAKTSWNHSSFSVPWHPPSLQTHITDALDYFNRLLNGSKLSSIQSVLSTTAKMNRPETWSGSFQVLFRASLQSAVCCLMRDRAFRSQLPPAFPLADSSYTVCAESRSAPCISQLPIVMKSPRTQNASWAEPRLKYLQLHQATMITPIRCNQSFLNSTIFCTFPYATYHG